MRCNGIISGLLLATFLLTGSVHAGIPQKKGGNVTTEERKVPPFTGVEAGGAFRVFVKQSGTTSVKIETDEEYQAKITAKVEKDVLKLSAGRIKNPSQLNVYVEMNEIRKINASGAAYISSDGVFKSDALVISASGASSVKLDITTGELETKISGAASVKLTGSASGHISSVSGAGTLNGYDLITSTTDVEVSGAGNARVFAEKEVITKKSGAGSIKVKGDPKTMDHSSNPDSDNNAYFGSTYGYNYDSTRVKIGNLNIDVYENNDEVKIKLGKNELFVDTDGNVSFSKAKRNKFNGHWAGLDLGINGYFNKDGNMSFPREYEYLDLRMEKSIVVQLNFFEQNIPITRNQKFGLVSGLGSSWNNYRFLRNTRLNTDSSYLNGYIDKGVDIRKSKLSVWYLTVPLMFEFQTNSNNKKNSFHIAAGGIMNLRLSSHTKKYYNSKNAEMDVTKYNPGTDAYETLFSATSPNQYKVKNFDDFFLAPIKWDATVRIGWGFINLFANYSLNTMFRKDKGPELYPWSIGITLSNL